MFHIFIISTYASQNNKKLTTIQYIKLLSILFNISIFCLLLLGFQFLYTQ